MALTEQLQVWLAEHQGSYYDLVLAGRPFGGRAGESPQLLAAMSSEDDVLVVRFEPTETLTIVRPSRVQVKGADLIIRDADEVTFGWHYYGRERTDANWCTESYRFDGRMVVCTRTGPIVGALPSMERSGRGRAPAVELICAS
jgi:hypothetical protein